MNASSCNLYHVLVVWIMMLGRAFLRRRHAPKSFVCSFRCCNHVCVSFRSSPWKFKVQGRNARSGIHIVYCNLLKQRSDPHQVIYILQLSFWFQGEVISIIRSFHYNEYSLGRAYYQLIQWFFLIASSIKLHQIELIINL